MQITEAISPQYKLMKPEQDEYGAGENGVSLPGMYKG